MKRLRHIPAIIGIAASAFMTQYSALAETANQKRTAVVLIDVQERMLRHVDPEEREREIPNMLRVLDYADERNLPVIWIENDDTAYGFAGPTEPVLEERLYRLRVPPIRARKKSNNAFCSYRIEQGGESRQRPEESCPNLLEEKLQEMGITDVLLMGLYASGCVRVAAGNAVERGYQILSSRDIIADSSGHAWKDESAEWYGEHGIFTDSHKELFEEVP